MQPAITNPLFGIETGSTIDGDTGTFVASVLKLGSTKFVPQQSGVLFMSGNSDYTYSDYMNQGSLSIAGSYGVSGVSKVTAAVAGYLGNTHSEGEKSLSVTLNDIEWTGVEYVDFDDLSVSEFIACLKTNVGKHVEDILDKYVVLEKKCAGLSEDEIVDIATRKDEAFDAWQTSVQRFFLSYGTGLVVGVLWGGWGAVKLEFKGDNHEDRWKGGGSGEFTYAGVGGTFDIAGTYGHSESQIGDGATASVTAYYNGECVKALVNAWFKDLQEKATAGLSEVGKTPVTRNATLTESMPTPKIPDPVKPKADPKVADKIGNITSLSSLEAYAKAVAYDKHKEQEGDKAKSLTEFLEDSQETSNVSETIPQGAVSPFPSDDDAGGDGGGDTDSDEGIEQMDAAAPLTFFAAAAAHSQEKAPEAPRQARDMSAFEPLGVWVVDWSQLFPWICSAYSNDVPADSTARKLIQLKTLHQDFLTLSKLYKRFAVNVHVEGGAIDLEKVSESFSHGASAVATFMSQSAVTPLSPSTIGAFIKKTINGLSDSAGAIYRIWDKHGALRGAELGLGFVFTSEAPGPGDTTVTTIAQSGGAAPDNGPLQDNQPVLVATEFSKKHQNFEAFSTAVKGLPLIMPDGRVLLYLCFPDAKDCGILRQMEGPPYTLDVVKEIDAKIKPATSRSSVRGMDFWNKPEKLTYWFETKALDGTWRNLSYDLYPIPYTAARGVEKWRGCGGATGLGGLDGQLADIRKALADKPKWSLDSAHWKDTDWGDNVYSLRGLRLSYLGLSPDPGNVMPGT